MITKYLAYIALLAGWYCFCYGLYAKSIVPRYHRLQEKSLPDYSENIPFPLAFRWASDVPLPGKGFKELKAQFQDMDSTDKIVIVGGFFYRDEADSMSDLKALGSRRIQNAVKYLDLDKDRIIAEVGVQVINADVRSNPFEAIRFQWIEFAEILRIDGDTIELCFPLKDSLILPMLCYDRLNDWSRKHTGEIEGITHIIGTADGSGIAESTDIAFERAIVIKEKLIKEGWKEEQIQLSTGQRNNPLTLRNRCVIVFFE